MPSRPLTITARENLVSLLYEAAELEHGLSCSYLYATFSLKVDHNTFTDAQRDAVSRWRDVIGRIAAEEMLHLALISNLLTAIGAQPRLSRPNLPQQSRFYPGGLTISLRRFDDDLLTRFMHLERPIDIDVEGKIHADDDVDLDAEPPLSPPGSLTTQDDCDSPDADCLLTAASSTTPSRLSASSAPSCAAARALTAARAMLVRVARMSPAARPGSAVTQAARYV